MNEDFVSFNLAKKLKEKGFNRPCVAYYVSSCSKLYFNITQLKGCTVEDCLHSNNAQPIGNVSATFTDAPTISQVLKWLREEKKIHICIIMYEYTWGYTVYDLNTFFPEEFSSYYNTYEEASIAGIEYCLDNLI